MAEDADQGRGLWFFAMTPSEQGTESEDGEPGFYNLNVSSTCFSELSYNPQSGELRMTFAKGGQYTIPSISEADVDRWMRSMSTGGHFNSFIRGNY
jgi:hypothetical protein